MSEGGSNRDLKMCEVSISHCVCVIMSLYHCSTVSWFILSLLVQGVGLCAKGGVQAKVSSSRPRSPPRRRNCDDGSRMGKEPASPRRSPQGHRTVFERVGRERPRSTLPDLPWPGHVRRQVLRDSREEGPSPASVARAPPGPAMLHATPRLFRCGPSCSARIARVPLRGICLSPWRTRCVPLWGTGRGGPKSPEHSAAGHSATTQRHVCPTFICREDVADPGTALLYDMGVSSIPGSSGVARMRTVRAHCAPCLLCPDWPCALIVGASSRNPIVRASAASPRRWPRCFCDLGSCGAPSAHDGPAPACAGRSSGRSGPPSSRARCA